MSNYPNYTYPPPISQYEIDRYRRPLRRWANIIGVGLIAVQIVMMLAMVVLTSLFRISYFNSQNERILELMDQSAMLISYILGLWLPILFIVNMIKIPVHVAFPMRKPKPDILIAGIFICFGVSMIGSMASGLLSQLIESIFDVVPTMPDIDIPKGTVANIIYAVNIAVVPAIFEELLFRGAIMQSLRRFGDGFALVVSSILFAMLHGNLVQGPNAMLAGMVIGYFVLLTGSIFTGMIMHLVNNSLSVAFGYMLAHMSMRQSEMLNGVVFIIYIVLGGIGLAYMMIKHGDLFFRLPQSPCPLPISRRYAAFFITVAQIIFIVLTVLLTGFYFE